MGSEILFAVRPTQVGNQRMVTCFFFGIGPEIPRLFAPLGEVVVIGHRKQGQLTHFGISITFGQSVSLDRDSGLGGIAVDDEGRLTVSKPAHLRVVLQPEHVQLEWSEGRISGLSFSLPATYTTRPGLSLEMADFEVAFSHVAESMRPRTWHRKS